MAEELALEQLGGSAAAFTATNGPFRRGECAWMIRAVTSLPVPLSPVTSTVDSLCCRVSMSRNTRVIACERQMTPNPATGAAGVGRLVVGGAEHDQVDGAGIADAVRIVLEAARR